VNISDSDEESRVRGGAIDPSGETYLFEVLETDFYRQWPSIKVSIQNVSLFAECKNTKPPSIKVSIQNVSLFAERKNIKPPFWFISHVTKCE
jgi:hypothetical protein